MKSKWKKLIFWFNEYRAKKKVRFFGTSIYEEIRPNHLPSVIALILCFGFLTLFALNIHYLGDFLYWFVALLEITKVLKIPFLDQIKYYQYLSLFVFFYISVSLIWDLGSLLSKWNQRVYLLKTEIWLIKSSGFGKKLTQFPREQAGIHVEWNHSGITDYLGLNRLVWKKDGETLCSSPYFFPYGKNKAVLDKILKRN